jgi:NhaP-type Na+/H+ or K+/H+ antiporter
MPDWKESAMMTQFGSKGHVPLAYAGLNTLVWVIYVALVLLATQVMHYNGPAEVSAFTLAAAAMLYPLRRRVAHAAKQRFYYRRAR